MEKIEHKISELFVKELPSIDIGEYVMEALRSLDKIAYVRFASVYREFSDISQFVDTLRTLGEKQTRRSSGKKAVAAGKSSAE